MNKLKLYFSDDAAFVELEKKSCTIQNLSKSRVRHEISKHGKDPVLFYINNVEVDRDSFVKMVDEKFF